MHPLIFSLLTYTRPMALLVQLVMVFLAALYIISIAAICNSNESSTLNCSHMVTPNITNNTCLNFKIPCCDISTYIKNSSFKSDTMFCFLNGTHIIDLVDYAMLVIENDSNITLIGLGVLVQHSLQEKVTEYNFTPYEDDQNISFLQSTSVIQCKSPFAFIFRNVKNLNLKNMTIQDCGADVTEIIINIQGNESFPIINSIAFLMISITNLMFENISVQNSTGYGFVGINMIGDSHLIGSSFVGNNQHVKNTQLTNYSYNNNLLCSNDPCETPSVIYVTRANDWKIIHPGGNAIFVYDYIANNYQIPSLNIESCLFTLGLDDSIPLSSFNSSSDASLGITLGTGLGVFMLQESSYSVPININKTVSYRNQAWAGANFYFLEAYERSIIHLWDVKSSRGLSPGNGGGFYYTVEVPELNTTRFVMFDRCMFKPDCSPGNTISLQNVISLRVTESLIFGQIYACCYGSISINNSVFHNVNCNGGIQVSYYNVFLSNSTFNGAGLVSHHSNVNVADSTFTNCQSTALTMYFGELWLTGNIYFKNNSASPNGGALYLYLAFITIHAPANITFLNNSALERGGAIFITDDPYDQYCSFTFHDPDGNLSFPGITIFIDYSLAGVAGNVLYGGDIELCTFNYSQVPHYNSDSKKAIFKATTKIGQHNGNPSAMIGSATTAVYHCVNNIAMLDAPSPISAYPGNKVNISIIAVGQLYGASSDVVTYSKCDVISCPNLKINCVVENCTNQSLKATDLQPTNQNCTNYTYLVTANRNKAYSVLLSPVTTTYANMVPYIFVIDITECPFGFKTWSNISMCSADEVLLKYHIDNDVDTATVIRSNTIWIGNSSHNTLAVHSNCPYDYCNPNSITFRVAIEQDSQCNYNRTGVLCGGCKPNMSTVFGSNRCIPCTNDQRLWLLIPFSLMGVVLVMLLFLLNCTVSVGTIHGLVLYANIIAPGIFYRLNFPDPTRVLIFIAWLNFNFGFETCFYNGMNTIVKVWLQFVFPAYILLLVGVFIYLSRWSSLVARCFRRNAVAVLATLILLSYTKVLETVITVLASTKLDIGNTTANNSVWLADGTVLYAQTSHAFLLAAGIIVTATFLIPYTTILLLAPWIQTRSHWKMFAWINKLKPFLDTYQAPFKDQYRYWPGILLMVRVVLYIVFITNEGNSINANLLAIILILSFYSIITSRLSVYKHWPLSVLENYFLINLIFLSTTLLYIKDSPSYNDDGKILLSTSGGISLVVSICIIIYHLYVQIKDIKYFKSISKIIKFNKPAIPVSIHDGFTDVSNYGSCEYREPLLED